MRFTKVLKAICNTFIRKKAKIEPEGDRVVTEDSEAPEKSEAVEEMAKGKDMDDLERKIRRYRAFAYHHRKKRIRKKYLKRLLEISPVDRFIYKVNLGGIAFGGTWMNGCLIGVDYSERKDITPWSIGSRKTDHIDSRLIGGQWANGIHAGALRMTNKNHTELSAGYSDMPGCHTIWKFQEVIDEE